ncbi:MAG: DUF6531 domain-containing protein [bacterium JZ-2024 1]
MATGLKPFYNFWQMGLTPAREVGGVDLFLNTATGNLLARIHLFAPSHRVPLSIALHYNAMDNFVGFFGQNITSILDESLTEDPGTGNVVHRDETGALHLFTRNPDGSYNHPPGIYNTLTKNPDSTFDLKIKGGLTKRFVPPHLKLVRQSDRNGNAWVIERDAIGFPLRVYDEASGTNLIDHIARSGNFISEI